MNANPSTQIQEIVQTGPEENAFVVRQSGREMFRVAFPQSIIRRFFTASVGYVLVFQCRSSVARDKGNVCLVSSSGQVLWWAERRKSDDCYVEVRLEDDSLIGYDGSCDCWIDLRNGKVQRREFVK